MGDRLRICASDVMEGIQIMIVIFYDDDDDDDDGGGDDDTLRSNDQHPGRLHATTRD